jgi:hypothetical protein
MAARMKRDGRMRAGRRPRPTVVEGHTIPTAPELKDELVVLPTVAALVLLAAAAKTTFVAIDRLRRRGVRIIHHI